MVYLGGSLALACYGLLGRGLALALTELEVDEDHFGVGTDAIGGPSDSEA